MNEISPEIIQILKDNPPKPIRALITHKFVTPNSSQELEFINSTIESSIINPDTGQPYNTGGRPRTKRRRTKSSKRRHIKSRSSKKRRHYKTKKRVYRSTRFRTHR